MAERQRLLNKIASQQWRSRVLRLEPELCFRNVSQPFCDLGVACFRCHGFAELAPTYMLEDKVACNE